MENKVVVVKEGYTGILDTYLNSGWAVKMAIPQMVSGGGNYNGNRGDIHYVLEKEGDR